MSYKACNSQFSYRYKIIINYNNYNKQYSFFAGRIRKALENKSNMEDDRVAILEAQLAQAKLIAEEADKKYEEVSEHAVVRVTVLLVDYSMHCSAL